MAAEFKDDYKYPTDTVNGNEILTICIGQSGIYLGNQYYQRIMDECKMDQQGKFEGDLNNAKDRSLIAKSNTHFTLQKDSNTYAPRAIFADLDCLAVDEMRSSFFGSLMATDNFISPAKSQGSMIWAQGHYTEGAGYIDVTMDKIRNSIEICDSIQGFQFMHGLSGGVGGGWGSLVLLKIRDNYPDRTVASYAVYPSQHFYDERNTNIVTYNTLLALHQLIDNADYNLFLDNGMVLNGLKEKIGVEKPTMSDINWLMSFALSGATASFRFPSEPALNATMKALDYNLKPFPRLHFFTLAVSPFISPKINKHDANVNKIVNETLFSNNISGVFRIEDGKIINVNTHYRSGNANAIDKFEQWMRTQAHEIDEDCVRWSPHNLRSSYIYDGDHFCYEKYVPITTTSINHTTAIKTVFRRLCADYSRVYRRKAYLHWYKGEGMDEMEFQEADKNIRDLYTEYEDKENMEIGPGGGDDDEDEVEEAEEVDDDATYAANNHL